MPLPSFTLMLPSPLYSSWLLQSGIVLYNCNYKDDVNYLPGYRFGVLSFSIRPIRSRQWHSRLIWQQRGQTSRTQMIRRKRCTSSLSPSCGSSLSASDPVLPLVKQKAFPSLSLAPQNWNHVTYTTGMTMPESLPLSYALIVASRNTPEQRQLDPSY